MSRNSKHKRDLKRKKAKKLKNKNRNQHNKAVGDSGPVMMTMKNPMEELSDEQRKELIHELGENGKRRVGEILLNLDRVLREYDPLVLTAVISGYGLITGVDEGGIQSDMSRKGLDQAHIELLQALSLTIPIEEHGCLPVTSSCAVFHEVWDQLKEIGHAFKQSRMNIEALELSETERAIHQIQEVVRSNTQSVRNWGFHSQQITISKELYEPFDEEMKQTLGFSASNVIDVFSILVSSVDEKVSARFDSIQDIKSINNREKMVRKYHELIGQGQEEVDEFLEIFDIKNISKRDLFFLLLADYDQLIINNYFVDMEDLILKSDLDRSVVDNVIHHFSYDFGSLVDHEKEHFFLENPVWKKPIISKGGSYYCMIPQLFFSFVLHTMDEIVQSIDKTSLHARRSEYLEFKIEQIVKTSFPESKVVSGLKWKEGEAQYETDLVAFIDSQAIIIEAKSQKISKPALRGAEKRIKKHLEEILIEPSIQSARLEQRINDLRGGAFSEDPLIEELPVDINTIHKVIRVSVSLDDFATLQTNLGFFQDTGWIPLEYSSCPSMNLADFETLFDFLEHPVQVIHYLSRRSEIEKEYKIEGDELDFMGLYTATLLNVGSMVQREEEIMISGMSESLDRYYMSKDRGIDVKKPQPKMSELFKSIFKKLEDRATPRWSEMGCILGCFPPNDQIMLERSINRLSKIVHKRWNIEGHKNTLVYVPPESSEYALSVVLYNDANKEYRPEFVEQASIQGMEPDHVKYCLVIAINIDRKDIPYSFIGLVEG